MSVIGSRSPSGGALMASKSMGWGEILGYYGHISAGDLQEQAGPPHGSLVQRHAASDAGA